MILGSGCFRGGRQGDRRDATIQIAVLCEETPDSRDTCVRLHGLDYHGTISCHACRKLRFDAHFLAVGSPAPLPALVYSAFTALEHDLTITAYSLPAGRGLT